ncbi:N-acetylmuramoyl-L-alanine amidase AmiC [Paraglaciecola mesophila KMM 241]|uniref:N-acetylmuramoyl-L-alanine amidase n=1 Tax=Paraglaciecola mesophila KMM 241 TaxID=1128912 RepID=K6XZ71_9ALTE|nr:N-acetylmuramoyl-L-alanine amidase [Paraglaciecola mesophila]GAC25889.1 N-acetylmuramoyl-L-alanine amidase AmiC [Paraglaciecola mesophila KMM 241]
MKYLWQKITAGILSIMLLLVVPASFAKNAIDSVRIWPSPGSTRIVFDLEDTPEYSYFTLSNPERLVVDLANTNKNFDFATLASKSPLVKKLRYSSPKEKGSIRVVIELNKKLESTLFALPPTEPYRNRLVIDLDDKNAPQTAPTVVKHNSSQQSRDIVIVLDAGHGGEDPGSIGRGGTFEKNITLNVAQRLAKLIDAEPGMKAVMTRSGDYYISPNKRPDIARKHKADLLISIHADAFTTPQPRGASVWVLSMRRANSELGRWMEKSERHSELLGGAAEVIQDTASERYLTQALLDMSMDHSLTTSYDLSRKVIGKLRGITRMHKKIPQAASLAVLTAPDIPSILVETGFISNPSEEKNLNWSKFRQQLADSIFTAVKTHFLDSPPDDSLWAKQKRYNRTHRVRSGESLSLLAQRYNVDVGDIKAANNLNSDVVRIGQVLTIPRT